MSFKYFVRYMKLFIFISFFNCFYADQTIIQSKLVCLCDLDSTDLINIFCPRNLKIHITNAYTFDDTTHYDYKNCSSASPSSSKFFVREIVGSQCNNLRNCTFSHATLHGPGTDQDNTTCDSATFEWICILYTSDLTATTAPDTNYNSWSMGFTYFFYIITLVLSTTCIIVGAVFLIRRFVIMRRRSNARSVFSRSDRGSLYRFWIRYQNRNNENNNNSTTGEPVAQPPPTYDDIYSISTAVNPLPSYSSAITLKSLDENKTTENQQATQNPATTTATTVQHANTNYINNNFDNATDVIDSNNSIILNGEINLAFLNEETNQFQTPTAATTTTTNQRTNNLNANK